MELISSGPRVSSLQLLEEQQVGLGDSLGATVGLTFTESVSPSAYRWYKQRAAELQAFGGEVGLLDKYVPPTDETQIVSKADATERMKQEGVELDIPERGMSEYKFNELVRLRHEQNQLKSIQASHEGGLGTEALKLTTAIGVSLLDPANVALAFVPIVGEVRYSMMLAQATGAGGRAGVRATVGALEGMAGAAIAEPLIYSQAQNEQRDYTLADSFLNLAFGTVFGGGLHMGAGAIGDAIRLRREGKSEGRSDIPVEQTAQPQGDFPRRMDNLPPNQREALIKLAVWQTRNGYYPDITDALQAMEQSTAPRGEAARQAATEKLQPEIERVNQEFTQRAEQVKTEVESLQAESQQLEAEIQQARSKVDAIEKQENPTKKQRQHQKNLGAEIGKKQARLNEKATLAKEKQAEIEDIEPSKEQTIKNIIEDELSRELGPFREKKLNKAMRDTMEGKGIARSMEVSQTKLNPAQQKDIEELNALLADDDISVERAQQDIDNVVDDFEGLPEEARSELQAALAKADEDIADIEEMTEAMNTTMNCKAG